MTEIDLIKSCKSGNAAAQKALYNQFADRMYRKALRYIKGQADAEDMVVITFTKVFRNIGAFTHQGVGSVEAWINKILINECLMWLRRRENFETMTGLEDIIEGADNLHMNELDSVDIYSMITLLPVGYRTVFNLYVIEGYSHQEIADALQVTESTSRTQLFKAKASLKEMLTKHGYSYGK